MSHKRKQDEKRKLKHLYDQTRHSVISGAYYDNKKQRYIRHSPSRRGSGYPKFLRKISNKVLRRKDDAYQYGGYKKLFDYKWRLW